MKNTLSPMALAVQLVGMLSLVIAAAYASPLLPSKEGNHMQQVSLSEQPSVTAIDVLLEPDATMLEHAATNNARLLKVFPKGFALDEMHRPHITLVQRFVRTADLDQVYAAAYQVLANANVNAMKLKAYKYYYTPGNGFGVAGIVARPTPSCSSCSK